MRILMMISKNGRYGAQRVFLDQVSALSRLGHSIIVVSRGTEGFITESVKAMGVECHGIAMKGLKDLFYLIRLVKKQKIDLIHTSLDRADYLGILAAKFARRPVITTMNVKRFHPGYRFADRVVTVSREQQRLLISKGVNPGNIAVIRPGIDIPRFSDPDCGKREAWKQKLGADRYSIVFCHIANMLPQKNHSVSIELIRYCKEKGEEPLLIVAGDPLRGEYYESLRKKITEAGLERNVYFTGWTSELPELLSLSHFTLLPSRHEALGMVLVEGMAAGTPIVASKGEGGAELIEDYETGFICSEEDIAAVAEKVVALQKDQARYAVLSERCKQVARTEFSLERYGEQLLELYRKVL